jgi:hypothetical protein
MHDNNFSGLLDWSEKVGEKKKIYNSTVSSMHSYSISMHMVRSSKNYCHIKDYSSSSDKNLDDIFRFLYLKLAYLSGFSG